jgi:hypothetical protein
MKPAHIHLIKWGLTRGYGIEVRCEGEIDYQGQSYSKAVEAVEDCDIGTIYLTKGDDLVAWFDYVLEYERNPEETISDYICNDLSGDWVADYDLHCKRYPINNHFSRSNN